MHTLSFSEEDATPLVPSGWNEGYRTQLVARYDSFSDLEQLMNLWSGKVLRVNFLDEPKTKDPFSLISAKAVH